MSSSGNDLYDGASPRTSRFNGTAGSRLRVVRTRDVMAVVETEGAKPDRKSWLRQVGRWLFTTTDEASAPTVVEARRTSWLLTIVAIGLLVLTLTDLPPHGWTFYVRALGVVAIASIAVRSWRGYRRLRSRSAGGH